MVQSTQPTPKPVGVQRITMGISFDRDSLDTARELARRYDGDNVSHLIRRLIRAEWKREQKRPPREGID